MKTAVTYREQQTERYDKYFNCIGEILYDPEDSYNKGVRNTEEIFMERLQNKLTPIYTLLELLKRKNNFSEVTYNKLLSETIKSADNTIHEILNITRY